MRSMPWQMWYPATDRMFSKFQEESTIFEQMKEEGGDKSGWDDEKSAVWHQKSVAMVFFNQVDIDQVAYKLQDLQPSPN